MGVGSGIGAGISGYYGAKKLRNESEATDAEMRIQELEDRLRELEQPDKVAAIPETYRQNRHEAAVEAAKRKGQMIDAGYEENRAIRTENEAERGEQTSEAGHPGAMESARNTYPEAVRTEDIASREHAGKVIEADDSENEARRGITRQEQVADQETTQVRAQKIYNSVPEVERAFEASNFNGSVFDDWYDKYFPNDHNIDTINDPDVPGGYIQTDNYGNVHKVGSKEELLTGFRKAFGSQEQVERMMGRGNLGREPGSPSQRGTGYGIGYGGRGRGGSGGGGTQLERLYTPTLDAIQQKFPEMEPWQHHLETLKVLKARGGEPDEIFMREWDADMLEAIMGIPEYGGRRDDAMKQFWKFRKILSGEDRSGDGAPVSDDETVDDWLN